MAVIETVAKVGKKQAEKLSKSKTKDEPIIVAKKESTS